MTCNKLKSPLILPPWIWLLRFRKRCGYGVHSPFAFDFITGVIYESGQYYAYRELDRLLPLHVQLLHLRPRKLLHLLFRVANYAHPQRALYLSDTALPLAYMQKAVQTASWSTEKRADEKVDFIYLDHASDGVLDCVKSNTILVLFNLRDNLAYWSNLLQDNRVVLSFDLYDVGILMFDKQYNRKDYIVNF